MRKISRIGLEINFFWCDIYFNATIDYQILNGPIGPKLADFSQFLVKNKIPKIGMGICYKYNLKLMHNFGFPSPECSKIWIIINLRNNNIWQKFPLQTLHTGTRFQFSRKNKRICSRFRQRYYSSHQCDWIKELTLIQREVCAGARPFHRNADHISWL